MTKQELRSLIKEEITKILLEAKAETFTFSGVKSFMSFKAIPVFKKHGIDVTKIKKSYDPDSGTTEITVSMDAKTAEKIGRELEKLDTVGERYGGYIQESKTRSLKEEINLEYSYSDIIDMIKGWAYKPDSPKKRSTSKILTKIGFLDKDGETINSFKSTAFKQQYKTTDGKTLEDVFKWWSKYVESTGTSTMAKKQAPSKTPKSGEKLNDDALSKYLRRADVNEWFDLLSDEGKFNSSKFTKIANAWLKDNGYAFQMSNASSKDDGETITWTVS